MNRVKDRISIVVGGANGMGKGSALELAREGAKAVFIIDYSPLGEEVTKEIEGIGSKSKFFKLDIREKKELERVFKEIFEEYGRIDILINSAGVGEQAYFKESDGEFVNRMMDINFYGIWNSCQVAIPYMLKNNYGKIVNFASVTGVMVVDPGMSAYASTKGAIVGLTKALAIEYANFGITVNAILPGMVKTPMTIASSTAANPDNPEKVLDGLANTIPMGRLGTIEEAGKVSLFLASDDSSYVTGTSIVFDGGSTLPESPGSGWEPIKK